MDRQQFYDNYIKPVLHDLSHFGGYNSLSARRLLLVTAEAESRCLHYVRQQGGPAESAYQMEPPTHNTVINEWDALRDTDGLLELIHSYAGTYEPKNILVNFPLYATAMARGYYAMDSEPLPAYNDREGMWLYYKRVWNTETGATDYDEFCEAWERTARVKL